MPDHNYSEAIYTIGLKLAATLDVRRHEERTGGIETDQGNREAEACPYRSADSTDLMIDL